MTTIDPQPIVLFVFFGVMILGGLSAICLSVAGFFAILGLRKKAPAPSYKPLSAPGSANNLGAIKNGVWYSMDDLLKSFKQ